MGTILQANAGRRAHLWWIASIVSPSSGPKFFKLMQEGGHIYGGLPALCPRHPGRRVILQTPDDFDKHVPEGGCLEPW